MATAGVPYGYTLVPQPMLGPVTPSQRFLPMPGGRSIYSLADTEDDEDEYVPPPPRPRSRIVDDDDAPEMEQFSIATKQIRKDADAILQRLNATKPKSKASDFFRNYDYDTKALTSKYLAPPPDRSHLRPTSPSLDDEPDPVLQSLRPGRGRRGGGGSGVSGSFSSRPILSTGSDRVFTPTSITANRIQSLYKDLDDSLYSPEIKSFDYTECLRRDREAASEKVKGDVSRRAVLLEPSLGLAESREKRSSVKRERLGYDPNSVRSNINIRAQYAAMRAAAGGHTRKPPSVEPLVAPASSTAPLL